MRIRTHIIGAALLVVVIANIVYGLYFLDREGREARLRLETGIEETDRLLGAVLAGPLHHQDLEQTASVLDAFLLNPDIVRIVLVDARGADLITRRGEPPGPGGELIDRRLPLRRGQQALGEVRVTYSTASIEQRLRRARNELVLLSLAWVLGLGGVILLGVRGLTRPIDRLTEAVQAMAAGRLDSRIEPGGVHEVAVLGESFLRMREAIGEQKAALERKARELGAEVAQRREAERRLERLTSIVEATTDLVGMADLEGNVLYLNQAGRALLGLGARDPSSLRIADLHPDWAARVIFNTGIPTALREGYWSADTALRTLDGREIPVSQVIVSHRDADGKAEYISTVIRDISERKRVEEALRRSDERLRQGVRVSQIGIFDHDHLSDTIYWSPELRAIFGWGPDEPKGLADFIEQLHPEDHARIVAAVHRAHDPKGDGLYDVEHRILRSDGRVRWLSTRSQTLFTGEGAERRPARTVGAVLDITERKRAEQVLRELTEQLEVRVRERTAELEAANRELEAFSYSVSHDLRAPLRAIDGFSRVLEEDYAAVLDEEGRGHLERIRRAVQRMGGLIDDMLQLARVSRRELRPDAVDLSRLAEELVGERRSAQPGREVEVSIQPGLRAWGDPPLLRAVLANLLDDAWKYTGRTPHPRIEFGAGEVVGERAYYVRDNGVGFDMQYADKLFGAFQRLHSEREFPGTGVGLATVARIIHRHGGRVWAEGEPGKGAAFYFTLPQARTESESTTAPRP